MNKSAKFLWNSSAILTVYLALATDSFGSHGVTDSLSIEGPSDVAPTLAVLELVCDLPRHPRRGVY